MPRKLADWLTAWEDFQAESPSPNIFRRWSGIAAVAGALERKVWVTSYEQPLYPNLYAVLVAPPGVGKSFVITQVHDMWLDLKTHHVASDSVSKASLVDELKEAERHLIEPGKPTLTFNALLIAADELGVLIPSYESEFMNTLNKIYDGSTYAERKRGKEINFKISKPLYCLLTGTQPSYLRSFLPEGAWDQGFTSRTILIYSGETTKGELSLVHDDYDADSAKEYRKQRREEYEDLLHDLKVIGALRGEFTWEKAAAHAMQDWYRNDGPPKPEHPKLLHYCTRRPAHLIKLCQIAAVLDSDKLKITAEHFDRALSWLIEAEHYMPDIFKALAQGGDAEIIKECWYFLFKLYSKDKKPIRESLVIRFLQDKTPAHNIPRLYETMVKGEILKEQHVAKLGNCVVPVKLQ